MKTEDRLEQTPYTTDELDEAAVWIARLHAPDRSRRVEAGFQRWCAEKPSHAAAFETISGVWELSGALKRRPFPKVSRWERAGFRAGFWRSSAVVAFAAALFAVGLLFYMRTAGLTTGVGEQRVVVLEDGSRISLNTASRVVVHYDTDARRVELERGEAFFEVAKDPARPFIVLAAHRRIEALGTSFVVREEDRGLSVTLVEGKVAVSSSDAAGAVTSETAGQPSQAAEKGAAVPTDHGVITLAPGQRFTVRSDVAPAIDRPSLERITAWRRGQIELEETPLAEAAREMNRYSMLKLRIERAEAAQLPINGVFRAGDMEGFAAAVARSYALTVQRNSHEIVLTGTPSQQSLSQN